jgi:hypothetical protein
MELIKFLLQYQLLFIYQPFKLSYYVGWNPFITGKPDRFKPEFAYPVRRLNMDVWWFQIHI